jgi:phosphatidylserine decarboxylase
MAFREALPFLLIAGLITVISWFFSPLLNLFGLLTCGYIIYFFRDPERPISTDPKHIVCPADGKIIAVDEVDDPAFSQGRMKRVAVFLSVFDVHVNRAPYEGKIQSIVHKSGQFLDARTQDVDMKNESQSWLIQTSKGSIVVRQIAGLIARRIVAWKKENDSVQKGERFGMIRFGSRTDVYLPLNCKILVKVGDRVEGGAHNIAEWNL